MKFQYTPATALNTKGKLTKRPMVELELISINEPLGVLGLIDSGADTTMMNIEYAKLLGIDLEKANKKEFLGIGDARVVSYISEVTMKVKHLNVSFTTPVAFTDSPSVDVLLGQEDFFECFKVKFEKDHDTFELTPVRK